MLNYYCKTILFILKVKNPKATHKNEEHLWTAVKYKSLSMQFTILFPALNSQSKVQFPCSPKLACIFYRTARGGGEDK